MDNVNDSPELEALFDSIASSSGVGGAKQPIATPKPARVESSRDQGDSDELQALFDSISSAPPVAPVASSSVQEEWPGQEKAFNSIGLMARQLHDALFGLGYDKLLEKTISALPDAKDRLAYVANLTEQAACRVLNATDIAMPLQDQLEGASNALADRWDRLYANQLSVSEFKALAAETRAFLKTGVPEKVTQTNAQLMEIMMAQDFQDLTGQVIKKIVVLAQDMESSIMSVLIEIIPEMKKTEEVTSLLNGPVVSPEGRLDIVVGQGQVDDLLESLGF